MSGLLNMALDGLDTILKNKRFSYSKGTQETKEMWIRKSDSFTAFCMDYLDEDENGRISKKVLKNAYYKYKKKHRVIGVGDKAFRITLENMFGANDFYQDNSGERFWDGIRFKENTKEINKIEKLHIKKEKI